MHNHHIFLAFCLALWFWPGTSAAAVAQEGASAPSPSLYNEYNNSTVYNGDVYVSDTAPGYNGFAGTWRDPETGDIITSVIAPRQPLPQEQNGPLIVAPQIYPGGGQSPFPPGGGVQPPYPPGPPPRPYPGPPPRPYPGPPPGFRPDWPGARPPIPSTPGWRPPQYPGSPPRPYPGFQPGQPGVMPPGQSTPGWRPPVPRNSVAPYMGSGNTMNNRGAVVGGARER
ncbi:hypothetical protein [uncultured Desulfovibrio sp.]|uniref:hypothetical protein n=1 Tax=uncultured Desulfovibrio sp. TaxID=167968 RepID=UPI00262EEBE6|nr:hypothetical protein [uncultured Desulfovibrio sp.]